MTGKHFQPEWMSPPGATICDLLEQHNLSRERFSEMTGYSLERVDRLLSGRLSITQDVADALQKLVGGSAEFWLSREDQYRNDISHLQAKGDLHAARAWLNELPVRDMKKFGWIKAGGGNVIKSDLDQCLRFFDVASVSEWRKKYHGVMSAVSFRTSLSFESQPGPVLTWLRYGEMQATKIKCRAWNAKGFRTTLPKIRQLTRNKDPNSFLPILKKLCAEHGVALVIARAPAGCHASGATRFIAPDKAMMLLSFRYLSDDQFWFTFFHEAAHLLLHSHRALFIEDGNDVNQDEEDDANRFAEDILVPPEYRKTVKNVSLTKLSIIQLAVKLGISRGILVGQLQHMKRLSPRQFNRLKRRFNWPQMVTD